MYMNSPAYLPPPDDGLCIVYEDEYLIVLDKPSGLLSVPGRGPDKADCMAGRAQRRYADAQVVHRLDMETSGLFLMARGNAMQRALSMLFERRQIEKHYIAVIAGLLAEKQGEIDLPLITDWPNRPRQKIDHLCGKPALTGYQLLDEEPQLGASRVVLTPHTGRSHQLRVHMLAIGHPILGDALYAPPAIREKSPRLLLHAQKLHFKHPVTNQYCEFASTPPF
jgi:tRNA pseudouridine32 synthase / 23S rRNA pseudouridine746 synthase